MTRIKQQAVQFTALETAQLVEVQADDRPLDAQEVTGRTLKTLISSGTELACYQGQLCNTTFPMQPGYAAVFQIKEIGGDVTAFKPGDLAFCMGPHRSFQRAAQQDALQLPPGLPPEVAVFARLMGVSMSTLTTTTARPPAIVLVSGLGPVGHLAAKIFHRCGYEVIAVDPIDSRRALLKNSGIERVFPRVPLDDSSIAKQVALVVECSGHEQALLDACNVVMKRGEVAMVGVPWSRKTNLPAHELLYSIFHNYVVLRSGWEWEVPRFPLDFQTGSIHGNFAAALKWLAEGSVSIEGLYEAASPHDAQQVYQNLQHTRSDQLAVVLDWEAV